MLLNELIPLQTVVNATFIPQSPTVGYVTYTHACVHLWGHQPVIPLQT